MRLFNWFKRRPEQPQDTFQEAAADPEVQAAIEQFQRMAEMPANDAGHEHEFTEGIAIQVGAWVRIRLPNCPSFVGYTYFDRQAGFSAKGGPQNDADIGDAPPMTVRLEPMEWQWRELADKEIVELRLPQTPSWVEEFYGPQPPRGMRWGEWRQHPKIQGRFHPDFPDDIQVLIHDGGPRLSQNPGELAWARVFGRNGEVFRAILLNQPHKLTSKRQGDDLQFIVPDGSKHPLQVTQKYLMERRDWIIHPCSKCGLSELFDAPSDLMRVVFPTMPEDTTQMFTSFCPLCGGVQSVQSKKVGREQ
jgi:hypothetical protein